MAAAVILFALAYAAAQPNSFLRYTMFRTAYSVPQTRGWMLRQYSYFLDNNNAGYMGISIERFLCSRLASNPPDAEMKAVLEFYSLRAGGREGYGITQLPDEVRRRAIPLLLGRLDAYDNRQAYGALVMVEQMRRGKIVCKAYFFPRDFLKSAPPNFNEREWWVEKGLPEAKTSFQTWWNSNVSWQEKKSADPLGSSNVMISENCG
ncbi:MAG: hypothetical protein LC785_13375 [Acidobacteria bacterium]|nr:hypothetical protein [Acidobacteriota bacterium]